MLSGIKTGKRKGSKKRPQGSFETEQDGSSRKKRAPGISTLNNLDAAALLRAQLSSGRPQSDATSSDSRDAVILTGPAAMASKNDYAPQDFRNGSRKGKIKHVAVDTIGTTQDEAKMSIQEMLKQEKESNRSMDEIYARNVARLGSRFKGTELKPSSSAGADEEDFLDTQLYSKQRNLTAHAIAQRERSRQLAQHDKQSSVAERCWWWMQSPSFSKHRMIALGNHVSLVMAPPNLSLFPGHHFYIVPVSHADSLAQCDEHVWEEIERFQTALRTLYDKKKKDVIFCETVLPSSKGFWQTKMECIPIKASKNDASMVFRTEMMEQAEEWGTNNKLLKTSASKPLRRTVPGTFPYFYVEFAEKQGYVMILENNKFPKQFGVDAISGMLRMEPMKFRSNSQRHDEKGMILDFLELWKPVDWTGQLDG